MSVDLQKEVMRHADVQFKPHWIALADQHGRELRQAQLGARQTHNVGAMLPAEAACYISHAKALVIARAKCLAQAYNSFGEAAGRGADEDLSKFYSETVAARKAAFQEMVQLRATRTRDLTTLTQLTGLLAGFDREANVALNGAKKNNSRDALIAEAAIANGYVLLTADAHLRSVAQMHGGRVTFFGPTGVPGVRASMPSPAADPV
jgi:hypothetical protein